MKPRRASPSKFPATSSTPQIDRVARSYSRQARIPGFRQGKVPPTLIKKRFREQILHDVAHDLIPRAIDEALRERGLEPVDTPDVKDVSLDEGQALTFTATFETLPPIDPGPLDTISLRRPAVTLEENAVEQTLSQLQNRAARYEPVEGRGVEDGDTVTLDVERAPTAAGEKPEHHHDVVVEIGGKANPPGFDDELRGLERGGQKTFTIHYPGRLHREGDGGHQRRLCREGEGPPQAGAAGAGRRIREGRRRIRHAAGAARPRIGRICSARRKRKPTGRSAATC